MIPMTVHLLPSEAALQFLSVVFVDRDTKRRRFSLLVVHPGLDLAQLSGRVEDWWGGEERRSSMEQHIR